MLLRIHVSRFPVPMEELARLLVLRLAVTHVHVHAVGMGHAVTNAIVPHAPAGRPDHPQTLSERLVLYLRLLWREVALLVGYIIALSVVVVRVVAHK